MLIKIPDNLKDKMEKYVDGSMSKIEIKKIIYKANISIREATLIHAYQIDSAISNLECSDYPKYFTDGLRRKEYWIESWRKFYKNNGASEALKHLEEVCEYIKKRYDDIYEYCFLLELDDLYYERSVENYNRGKGRKFNMKKFSA